MEITPTPKMSPEMAHMMMLMGSHVYDGGIMCMVVRSYGYDGGVICVRWWYHMCMMVVSYVYDGGTICV